MEGNRVKLIKCDTGEWDENCHYTSDILFKINLLLYYITLFWEKLTSYEKFGHNLMLEMSTLPGKFQSFNAINGSIEILKNEKFWNILRAPNSEPP